MSVDLSDYLVIGISSRALFNLEKENEIFEKEGLRAYCEYQREHEDVLLEPGAGFELVKAILRLNETPPSKLRAEVVIVSRNSADTGLRIFNSIEEHSLDIKRAAFTGGEPVAKYLNAFNVHLFLSAFEQDVKDALNAKIAAGLIYAPPEGKSYQNSPTEPIEEIRIAFDGDAVIFSDESEKIYKEKGLEAFEQHEKEHANDPLLRGPFAKLLQTLSEIQKEIQGDKMPIRTALVTARRSPAHERVIRTLRVWDIQIDESFFLGGLPKERVLQAFGAHIFFDDQDKHCKETSKVVPTARV